MQAQPPELLTAQELADRLRVSTHTVKAWTRQGAIPVERISPKVLRYRWSAVVAALCPTWKAVRDEH